MLSLVTFVHMIGVSLLMSSIVLHEILGAAAKRAQTGTELAVIARLGGRVPMLAMPGAMMSLLTGTGLVVRMGYGAEPWIVASYAFWLVAFLTSLLVLRPAGAKAQAAAQAGDEAALRAALLEPVPTVARRVNAALALSTMALMIWKP